MRKPDDEPTDKCGVIGCAECAGVATDPPRRDGPTFKSVLVAFILGGLLSLPMQTAGVPTVPVDRSTTPQELWTKP